MNLPFLWLKFAATNLTSTQQIWEIKSHQKKWVVCIYTRLTSSLAAGMQKQLLETLPRFLERLGFDEEPMGIFYTDNKPTQGFTAQPIDLPTRSREMKNEINRQDVFSRFEDSFLKTDSWATVQKKDSTQQKDLGGKLDVHFQQAGNTATSRNSHPWQPSY